MSSSSIVFVVVIIACVGPIYTIGGAGGRHLITFRSPNLFPEGITYDPHPSAQHFLVGSLHHRSIHSVDDRGRVQTLISDRNLPPNVTILGLTVDSINRRLLAVIHAIEPLPPFNALAVYNLSSLQPLFLTQLTSFQITPHLANDVTVDFLGNAYVTDSIGNLIWKVTPQGESSVFSQSPTFAAYPIPRNLPPSDLPIHSCGLNGIAYVSKGFLLVVQTNTGKVFKVDEEDGKARLVIMSKDLIGADGIAMRSDGVAVVVSQYKLWLLKSHDGWGEAVVYDEIALKTDRFPTSVVTKDKDNKAYVLYGNPNEGILGRGNREVFAIEGISSSKDRDDEMVWLFVVIGLALAYFMFWRFQMGQLAKNMNKKVY